MFQEQIKDKEIVVPYDPPAWKPPQHGRFKINTDASWRKDGKAVGGGVVRIHDGRWVSGFSVKFQARDPPEAELRAMRFGLEFIKALEIDKFDVEIDAEEIIKILKEGGDFTQHYLAPILHDVAALISQNDGIDIVHASRNHNRVAHGLAEFGMKMKCMNSVHNDYETDLRGSQIMFICFAYVC